ncbi:hypothetical protein MMALV_13190 [Candidatus Methanomethylophilus alvi Mx1201]|uniref:Uncharacterized protein n=1 Tax=Methanomethylophilus alvi (strain Mx1201) TaxID=1236689 RepID=M9SIW3_METAX|nr:hypothetical protein MMALV_13190 [Candidatus Methanomethylophilus alvi Mx1201]
MAAFRSLLSVAATAMNAPSRKGDMSDGSKCSRTISSHTSSIPGTVLSATTVMRNPSNCRHLRYATIPPPNTTTFLSFVGSRNTGTILGDIGGQSHNTMINL